MNINSNSGVSEKFKYGFNFVCNNLKTNQCNEKYHTIITLALLQLKALTPYLKKRPFQIHADSSGYPSSQEDVKELFIKILMQLPGDTLTFLRSQRGKGCDITAAFEGDILKDTFSTLDRVVERREAFQKFIKRFLGDQGSNHTLTRFKLLDKYLSKYNLIPGMLNQCIAEVVEKSCKSENRLADHAKIVVNMLKCMFEMKALEFDVHQLVNSVISKDCLKQVALALKDLKDSDPCFSRYLNSAAYKSSNKQSLVHMMDVLRPVKVAKLPMDQLKKKIAKWTDDEEKASLNENEDEVPDLNDFIPIDSSCVDDLDLDFDLTAPFTTEKPNKRDENGVLKNPDLSHVTTRKPDRLDLSKVNTESRRDKS